MYWIFLTSGLFILVINVPLQFFEKDQNKVIVSCADYGVGIL